MNINTFLSFMLPAFLLLIAESSANLRPLRPLIPSHTGPISITGKVEVSGVLTSCDAGWNAFSDNSQLWISGLYQAPAWATYEFFGSPRVVRAYRFLYGNGRILSRAPKRFAFQVLRGSKWVTINTRCCETEWAGTEERTFHLDSAVVGQKFRFLFYEDNDSRSAIVVISLKRIQIL